MGQSPCPNSGLPGEPSSPQLLLGGQGPHGLSSGPDQCWWLLQQQPAHVRLDPQKALPNALAFWERRERQLPGPIAEGRVRGLEPTAGSAWADRTQVPRASRGQVPPP